MTRYVRSGTSPAGLIACVSNIQFLDGRQLVSAYPRGILSRNSVPSLDVKRCPSSHSESAEDVLTSNHGHEKTVFMVKSVRVASSPSSVVFSFCCLLTFNHPWKSAIGDERQAGNKVKSVLPQSWSSLRIILIYFPIRIFLRPNLFSLSAPN